MGRQSLSLASPETSNIQEQNNTHDPLSPGLTTPRSDTRKIYMNIKINQLILKLKIVDLHFTKHSIIIVFRTFFIIMKKIVQKIFQKLQKAELI